MLIQLDGPGLTLGPVVRMEILVGVTADGAPTREFSGAWQKLGFDGMDPRKRNSGDQDHLELSSSTEHCNTQHSQPRRWCRVEYPFIFFYCANIGSQRDDTCHPFTIHTTVEIFPRLLKAAWLDATSSNHEFIQTDSEDGPSRSVKGLSQLKKWPNIIFSITGTSAGPVHSFISSLF